MPVYCGGKANRVCQCVGHELGERMSTWKEAVAINTAFPGPVPTANRVLGQEEEVRWIL